MELFERLRLIIKGSKFVFIISVVYAIMLILYSSITIINNELRSQNVHITSDGEIVINDLVQSSLTDIWSATLQCYIKLSALKYKLRVFLF